MEDAQTLPLRSVSGAPVPASLEDGRRDVTPVPRPALQKTPDSTHPEKTLSLEGAPDCTAMKGVVLGTSHIC